MFAPPFEKQTVFAPEALPVQLNLLLGGVDKDREKPLVFVLYSELKRARTGGDRKTVMVPGFTRRLHCAL